MKAISLGLALAVTAWAPAVAAEVTTETVMYTQDGAELEGLIAFDKTQTGKRPAVLIIHDWMGVGSYVKKRAEMLAQDGYVAFAADIYGKGIRPKNNDEASAQASKFRGDRKLLRARAQAGLAWLKTHKYVDANKVAAIGYCFGGGAALELARAGADLKGVISFHGNLDTPNPTDAKQIKAKVLALHGADDPFVKPEQVAAFETGNARCQGGLATGQVRQRGPQLHALARRYGQRPGRRIQRKGRQAFLASNARFFQGSALTCRGGSRSSMAQREDMRPEL